MKGSNRLGVLAESATLAMSKRVRELKAEGKDIIGLTLGEPDFDTPLHIRQAAIQAVEESDTHYPPVAGKPELRDAVATRYQRDFGLPFTPSNVMVSTGAKQALVNVIMSLVNPGEETIMVAPYWVSYREMLKMAEAKLVTVQTRIEHGFKLQPEDLEAAITPNTKLIIFNNPNNPTGATHTPEELAALAAVLERHPHVYMISDEIYEHLTYGIKTTSMATFESIRERVIIINGVSKAFAMTGWRIGFTIAAEWLIKLCEKYQGQITSGASTISQRAATAAMTGSLDATEAMRVQFQKRRDFLHRSLTDIPGLKAYLPEGAFYFYPDLSAFIGCSAPDGTKLDDIDAVTAYILNASGLALIPGSAFGTDKHVRISYAYDMASLEDAMQRLKSCLSALK